MLIQEYGAMQVFFFADHYTIDYYITLGNEARVRYRMHLRIYVQYNDHWQGKIGPYGKMVM